MTDFADYYAPGTTEDDVNAWWAASESADPACPECGTDTVWNPIRDVHCERCGWSEHKEER